MSITLDYISINPVSTQIAVKIVAEAAPLPTSYDWWAEPLNLEQRVPDKRLEGSTRVRLGGYGLVDVPPEEEALMVCRDTSFVVVMLAKWSAKHKVSWRLSELGTEVGSIVDGKRSATLSSYVSGLCSQLKLPLSKASEILKKHEGRRD
ncbi:MAG: hypothetical protein V4582_02730 [Pseudomonadota bacterium]